MVFVTHIYAMTQAFPSAEQYGLTSQLRRAAISLPSNIAEGYGRQSTGDYTRFLHIAVGSLFEIQTQLEISFNLSYLKQTDFEKLIEQSREVERMLSSLIQKLKK